MSFTYNFFSPEWDHISDNAKGLIKKLLQLDPKLRPTASEALENPFITQEVSGGSHMQFAQASLKKFLARRRLKKGILAVAGMTRMKKLMAVARKDKEVKEEQLEEQRERDLMDYLMTTDKVLQQSIDLVHTVSNSAAEHFNSVHKHPPEYNDSVERILKRMETLNLELNSLKGAYLKTLMKEKDLSQYFLSK